MLWMPAETRLFTTVSVVGDATPGRNHLTNVEGSATIYDRPMSHNWIVGTPSIARMGSEVDAGANRRGALQWKYCK